LPLFLEILFIIIIGSSLGSFFNVCIYRIPLKKSIVFPASHCPDCSRPIPKRLNIPLIGFFLTLGKCRECGSKIHWHYPLVEFLTPLLLLLLFFRFDSQFSFLYFKYVLLISLFIIVFFIDSFFRIIPDVLSIPLIIAGLIASLHPSNDLTLFSSLIGGASGFFFFYLISFSYWKLTGKMGMGGGDIKLVTAIGTFIGIIGILFTILVSSILALIILLLIRHNLKKEFPFGPFLIGGTMIYLFWGNRIIDWYLSYFFS
jgi:leader peptidase (prepilin peptidase)/N-methyltransferase